ncbi:MAG: CHASE3 domain-containing protein [Chitinophagaceae bacterium]
MVTILKTTKTEKFIRNVYIIAFILLFAAYLITLYAKKQLERQVARVELTNNIIKNLDNLLLKIVDGETGLRGYVITKNPEFLDPYTGSIKMADSFYNIVTRLTNDDPAQQVRLISLRTEIDRRFEEFRFGIGSFNNNNDQVSDTMRRRQFAAKNTMDNIRTGIAIIESEENRKLTEWNNKMKQTFNAINAFTIISPVIAFSLLLFGFLTYMKVSKERKRGLQEITDYQEELRKRIDELAEANVELIKIRSQEKFAATGRIARTIAHEVRNPLTNINLAVDQLKSEVVMEQDETSIMLFDMIKRNSARINQLISDLLNSTKFSELAYEQVSINQLLDETLKGAEDRIALTNVSVIKNYGENICELSVDKEKLKIAFLNIIINALEAMASRPGSVLILETREKGRQCKVTIRDNGPGLDSDAAHRLFEPYFTNKPKGNGLGLTNTQNIILNHKGEIYVETAAGKGTSFVILLNYPSK